jgi:phytoene/squalene synthetase
VSRDAALRLADERGRAFQVINIIRDIRSDAAMHKPRWYVPRDLMDSRGLSREALITLADRAACETLVRAMIARADAHMQASAGLDACISPACVPVLDAMTRVYAGVLDVLRREPSRAIIGPRATVPAWRKVAIGARALAAARWHAGVFA